MRHIKMENFTSEERKTIKEVANADRTRNKFYIISSLTKVAGVLGSALVAKHFGLESLDIKSLILAGLPTYMSLIIGSHINYVGEMTYQNRLQAHREMRDNRLERMLTDKA